LPALSLLSVQRRAPAQKAKSPVVETANADEAIAILEERPDIHVVFTDIQMPGSMDELKLARFIGGP
jgi:CheY-like chemotaxis protein